MKEKNIKSGKNAVKPHNERPRQRKINKTKNITDSSTSTERQQIRRMKRPISNSVCVAYILKFVAFFICTNKRF